MRLVNPVIKSGFSGLALVICVTMSFTPGAHAQTLWRGAVVGDNLANLRTRFPEAHQPGKAQVLSGGETEALQLGPLPLDGRPAIASFFMRDGRLANVQLHVPTLASGASAANLAYARRVAASLSKNAGPGFDCSDDVTAAVAQFECRWLQGNVVVREYYLDVAGQAPIFYVAYHRADDPAFDL